MSTIERHPEWFCLGDPLLRHIPGIVYRFVDEHHQGTPTQQNEIRCAVIHFIHCLSLSVETNRKGQHAVAMCLLRQCAEALTVIEVGLLRDAELSASLLGAWRDGTKTAGAIRKKLEETVWSCYGTGLWTESWAKFIHEFSEALQPYAHYTPKLQSWQIALDTGKASKSEDGKYLLVARVGLDTYESNKATRVTLLHVILIYVLGRIVVENMEMSGVKRDSIMALGKAIAVSNELCDGQLSWHKQFWANEFTIPETKAQASPPDAPTEACVASSDAQP